MLVFGSGSNSVVVEPLGTHHCSTCGTVRPFHLVLWYRFWHFYYIFRLVVEEKYSRACEICGRGETLTKAQVAAQLSESPLTVWQRFGCLIWFAFLAVIIASLIIGGKMSRGEM